MNLELSESNAAWVIKDKTTGHRIGHIREIEGHWCYYAYSGTILTFEQVSNILSILGEFRDEGPDNEYTHKEEEHEE